MEEAHAARREEEKPNKVLFLRNCPRSITEEDILALVSPFSPQFPPRIYVQAAKGQAFVEFEDIQHASRCLQYFQHNLVQLEGSTLHFSYSTPSSVFTHEQLAQSYVYSKSKLEWIKFTGNSAIFVSKSQDI